MKSGTLGCIVTTADGKMAALSNEHVLRHGMHSDRRVYQPPYGDCLGFECNEIGESIAGLENHFEHEGTCDIRQFADEGDSGSILFDLSNRVIGIVTGLFKAARPGCRAPHGGQRRVAIVTVWDSHREIVAT